MKTGLVLEGGAMRGMFTSGVIDVFMKNGIEFDGAIGVSAGAVFGCNYKSHQIGRAIRYNKRYCRDKRYVSYTSWLKTGDLYGVSFCYDELPHKLDIFDQKTYSESKMDFYVVATNVETGKPEYRLCNNGDEYDLQWFRASASMPVFANVVEIDDLKLLDGGTSDSVPLKYFEGIGYDRNVVVMTQPEGYRKKPYGFMPVFRRVLKKYPKLIKALADRHIMYNEEMDYIDECERSGKAFVIRPPQALKIKPAEKNPDELERVYQMGVKEGERVVEAVKKFLADE